MVYDLTEEEKEKIEQIKIKIAELKERSASMDFGVQKKKKEEKVDKEEMKEWLKWQAEQEVTEKL